MCYPSVTNAGYKRVTPLFRYNVMTTNTSEILDMSDTIENLSDTAIKDIYSRQLAFKVAKKRKGYIKQDSNLFKGLSLEHGERSIHEAIRELDFQLYSRLMDGDKSLEASILDEFTKDVDGDKTQIMRHKLKTTTRSCGMPRTILARHNIEAWGDTEA